jgi:Predicted xylanase/chitin deacetylase
MKRALLSIFVGIISLFLLASCNFNPTSKKNIYVVFRYDDYSAISPTETELKILGVFQKDKRQITFGVIPEVVTDDEQISSLEETLPLPALKQGILRSGIETGTLDVGLHGYSHQSFNAKSPSEFMGLSYENQLWRIQTGKREIETITHKPMSVFIPPWNTYDFKTIKALENTGFTTLSADRYQVVNKDSALKFLPSTCTLSQLRNAIYLARISADLNPVIVVLLHSYDFKENNKNQRGMTYQQFSDLIDWVSSQRDINILSVDQASDKIKDLSARRLWFSEQFSVINDFLPSFFRDRTFSPIYQQYNVSIFTYMKIWLFYGITLILGTFLFFLIGYSIQLISFRALKNTTIGSIFFSSIAIFLILHGHKLRWVGVFSIVLFFTFSLGLIVSLLYFDKRKTAIGLEKQ